MRELLDEVDINYRYSSWPKQTPLIRAILHGNLTVVREILATAGLDATICAADDNAALHFAASNPAILRLLIESKSTLMPRLDLNQRGKYFATPLFKSCATGNLEAVKLLCAEPEVSPNIPAGPNASEGDYPLHKAVTRGGESMLLILRALADKGALMECENCENQTPYLLAFTDILLKVLNAPHNRLIALLALGAQKKPYITHPANGNNPEGHPLYMLLKIWLNCLASQRQAARQLRLQLRVVLFSIVVFMQRPQVLTLATA